MKRLHGFSLMEMMIVLTIVAIVAAASAPMVNKKMVRAASEKSPWVFTNGESIGYNIDNENGIQDRKTATIGANGRVPNTGGNPRLYIDTNSDTTPHILFGRRGGNLIRLIAGGDQNNIWFSNANISDLSGNNSVALGYNNKVSGNSSVSIGDNAHATDNDTVAIGNNARATFVQSIAIGLNALADTDATIAIGRNSRASDVGGVAIGNASQAAGGSFGLNGRANAPSSIAILGETLNIARGAIALGQDSRANQTDSVAIGNTARAFKNNSIAIGTSVAARNENAIALGQEAQATGLGGIAIGRNSMASQTSAIAIGHGNAASNSGVTIAQSARSIAIGSDAHVNAVAPDSIAIGTSARASARSSVAIGPNSVADRANTIVLGDENTTVVIPGAVEFSSLHVTRNCVVDGNSVVGGDLVVTGSSLLGNRYGSLVFLKESHKNLHGGAGIGSVYFFKQKNGDNLKINSPSDTAAALSIYNRLVNLSDRRLKNVGKEFSSGLDKIKKLEIFNYTFKDDKEKTPHVGVMAQDLQKVFPDAVVKGEDGFLRIRMEDMFYAVINAIKELDIRTSAQEKKIKELEKRIEELEKRI